MPRGFAGENEAGRANDPSGVSSGGGGRSNNNDRPSDNRMSPGRSQAQFGSYEFAGKTPQQAQNELNRGGGSDRAQAVQRAIAAQQAQQAQQAAARQAAAAEQARQQAAAAAAEQARQDQLAFAREQSLRGQYANVSNLNNLTDVAPTIQTVEDATTAPTSFGDFLSDRVRAGDTGLNFTPQFDERGNYIGNLAVDDEVSVSDPAAVSNAPLTQSEYEKLVGITDIDPYGSSSNSTAFGRGIQTVADQLGLTVDKRGNLAQPQIDFLRQNAYDKYMDPFGEGKTLTYMGNYNLSPEEKLEYERQQRIQGVDQPFKIETESERAARLGEDYNRGPNTIRSGLGEGDITQFGTVGSRPRDIGTGEMLARGALTATPLGLPLGILSAATDLDKELGIEGQVGPDGQVFRAEEGPGILGQALNIGTAGIGTRALDKVSQTASNIINQGILSSGNPAVDALNKRYGEQGQLQEDMSRPSIFEQIFSGGGSSPSSNLNNQSGDSDPILAPVIQPNDEVIDDSTGDQVSTVNPFGQEQFAGLSGDFTFDPTKFLGSQYIPPNYGIGGVPTNQNQPNRGFQFSIDPKNKSMKGIYTIPFNDKAFGLGKFFGRG